MKEKNTMSTMTDAERKRKLDIMKVMIIRAEKQNLNTREKKAEDMAKEIIKIIKNVHNRSDI